MTYSTVAPFFFFLSHLLHQLSCHGIFICCISYYACKDQFWLEPKTGMDSSPKNPNNKFVENERKSQYESREKILVDCIKRKELHMHKYKKYPWSCPNSIINSIEFFLFTIVFLQSFALFLFFLRPPSFESLFVLYTMVFAPVSPSTCESGVGSFLVPFRPSLNLLLLAVRLLVYCSGITSTLMRPKS